MPPWFYSTLMLVLEWFFLHLTWPVKDRGKTDYIDLPYRHKGGIQNLTGFKGNWFSSSSGSLSYFLKKLQEMCTLDFYDSLHML